MANSTILVNISSPLCHTQDDFDACISIIDNQTIEVSGHTADVMEAAKRFDWEYKVVFNDSLNLEQIIDYIIECA